MFAKVKINTRFQRAELTGRRRYRKYQHTVFEDKPVYTLVLQVEVSVWTHGREDQPGKYACVWRDATPDDVGKGEIV